MSLFELGDFTLSSGNRSSFRINADVLTTNDWATLAWLAVQRVPAFGDVVGVPTGGGPFATALVPYATDGPVLVVDDVLTTGKSIERLASFFVNPILLVAFSRGKPLANVHVLFTISPPFEIK